jgi:hypothetical protein
VASDAESWQYSLTLDGYLPARGEAYATPTFTVDHKWLHLEARYNNENLRTGSLWVGYNFAWGEKWQFEVTPMIGGVFGRTDGIAPGCEASLTWKLNFLPPMSAFSTPHQNPATSITVGPKSPTRC